MTATAAPASVAADKDAATATLPTPVSIGDLLTSVAETMRSRGVREPERWAGTLVAATLNIPAATLNDHRRAAPTPRQITRIRQVMEQVSSDIPVAYLIGRATFLGRDFEVSRDTPIPRADTEHFLRIVFDQITREPLPAAPHVLNLCCGSCSVAVTLARELPDARVVAVDISPEALAVARRNLARHQVEGRVTLGQGDLWEPVADLMGGRRFDLIVASPPYVPTGHISRMGKDIADHEPYLALDGGEDGLDIHRRILPCAPEYLAPGGRLFLEHGYYHGKPTRRLAEAIPGFCDVQTMTDGAGTDRALFARRTLPR